MATGRRTVLPLPDGSPERLTGGFKNELLRYGDVVLRLQKTTIESAEWEHRLLHDPAADVPEVVVPRKLARLHRAGLDWDGGQRPGASARPARDLGHNGWWNREIVEAIVDASLAAGGPAETELLATMVRLRHVADVLYSLTSRARGEAFSREHVDRLLEALA